MNHEPMNPSLIVTHYGENPEEQFGAVVPPIYQNSLNVYPTVDCYLNGGDEQHPYVYMRVSNPTIRLAEQKIAALEKAEDALFLPPAWRPFPALRLPVSKAATTSWLYATVMAPNIALCPAI